MSPAARKEWAKWQHGLAVALSSGLYDGLSAGQAAGHVVLKSLALAIVVRCSGFAVRALGGAKI